MVIDFESYLKMKKDREVAAVLERQAELDRRKRLELVLTDLLAELEAA